MFQIEELPGNSESSAIVVPSLPFFYAGDTTKYTSEFSGPVVQECIEEATAPDVFFEYFSAMVSAALSSVQEHWAIARRLNLGG